MVDIRMVHTRSLSDMTDCYHVQLSKECTVEEFVNDVLIKNPDARGTIRIVYNQVKTGCGNPSCSYKRGVLESYISKYYLEQTIKEVCANGGWGDMDYVIILK